MTGNFSKGLNQCNSSKPSGACFVAARNSPSPDTDIDGRSPVAFVTGVVVSDQAFSAGLDALLVERKGEVPASRDWFDVHTCNGRTRIYRQSGLPT